MNKKGEEENHWGIVSGAILIFIAMIGVFFVYSDSFAEVKEGFGKVADTEVIKKAYSKTIGKESALTEEEKKIIDEFNLFFQRNFAVDDDDCIKEFNFDEIKRKGFGIRVDGKNIFAEKEGMARVYPLSVPNYRLLALRYFDENLDEFYIDEKFEKIDDEFEFVDVVYVKDGKINFLDEITAAVFTGLHSDVLKKNVCGEESSFDRLTITDEEVYVVPGTTQEEARDIMDYLNSDFTYNGGTYKVYEILRYIFDLEAQRRGDFPIEEEINFLLDELGDHIEEYFEDRSGTPITPENKCWRALASMGNIDEVITFGKSEDIKGVYRSVSASISLSDGSTITFRLFVSVSREGCLPAR
mgnify:CR=1 FL=1